jgi:hypothetical protein
MTPDIMGVIFRDAPSESIARLSESIASPAHMARRISSSLPTSSTMTQFGIGNMFTMGSEI